MNWGKILIWAVLALVVVAGAVGAWNLLRDGQGGSDDASASQTTGATSSDDSASSGDDAASSGEPDDAAASSADAAAPSPTDPPECGSATVWAAPEIAPAVEAAVARTQDDCFSYVVVPRNAALAQSGLRGGEAPDVWVPSSDAWPVLVQQGGVDLEIGETVASSPVLLAGGPAVVQALGRLGIGPDTSFGELVQTYQGMVAAGGDRPVTMRVGDPRVDPATMALLGAAGGQLDAEEAGSPGRQALVVLAQSAVQGDPLSAVAADPTTIVPATEQQLAAAAEAGTELQGLSLRGGAGVVRMPFVRIADNAEATDAVDALEQALTSPEAADDLGELGLRAGTDGEAPGVPGVPEGLQIVDDPVAAEQVATTAGLWTVIAPQSRILTLIDISGSMEIPVGDTTRIGLTQQAAQAALSVIPEQTAIGLWYFATALDGDTDYREEVPLRALNQEVRSGVTQKDVLLAETADLGLDTLTGDTGLHDSLWAAYLYMQGQYSPDSISSVLLLTDGINDDSTDGLSEEQVIELLTDARASGDRPVTVVLIGMGEEVDEEALGRLAAAAGGESLVLRDPRELPQVFVDVVARRAP